MSDYLFYWKPEGAEECLEDGYPIKEIWSKQLKRANRGDRIWIASTFDRRLHLYGMIEVQSIKPDEKLGFIAKGRPASVCPARRISLTKVVKRLRFSSSTGRTRLAVVSGLVDAQQLRTMRRLSPASAELLQKKFG